jgi:tetratricopeptide (TPR) repeat protein
VALSDLGKNDEAEQLLRAALAQCERLEGRTSEYATYANNLGAVLYRTSKDHLDEAIELFRTAMEINKQLLGPRHPDTLQNMMNLAGILHTQGKLDEAEPTYVEAIPMFEAVKGPLHPQVLTLRHNFALLRSDQGRFDEAQAMLLDVIAKAEAAFGQDHLTTIQFHIKLARNHLRAGRRQEAFELYQKYIPLYDEKLGPEHPQARAMREEYAAAFPDADLSQPIN